MSSARTRRSVRTVSQAVRDLVESQPFLQRGLAKGLFNLTKLSQEIAPLVAARSRKDVTTSAILMSLSRFSQTLSFPETPYQMNFDSLTLQTGLAIISLARGSGLRQKLQSFSNSFVHKSKFATITEGQQEVTLVLSGELLVSVVSHFGELVSYHEGGLGALSVRLDDVMLSEPGTLYRILEPLALQGISVVEVASTQHEFMIYLKEADLQIAFDTLYRSFQSSREIFK